MFFFHLSPILCLLSVAFDTDCLSVDRPHVYCHAILFRLILKLCLSGIREDVVVELVFFDGLMSCLSLPNTHPETKPMMKVVNSLQHCCTVSTCPPTLRCKHFKLKSHTVFECCCVCPCVSPALVKSLHPGAAEMMEFHLSAENSFVLRAMITPHISSSLRLSK